MIYQAVTLCPKTQYNITAQGKLGLPVNAKEKCYIQVCEKDSLKCSREASIVKTEFKTLMFNFTTKKTQTSGQIQVYVNCLGSNGHDINTVYLDNISIM